MGALDQAIEGNWKTVRKNQGNGSSGSGGYNQGPSKHGYERSELISGLQKSIRRGKEQEALFWAQELMESDETYRMWRRLVVIAAEDVGLADPTMTARIMTMKQAHDFARETNIPFQAIMMLCRAPKNREADDAAYLYSEKFKAGWRIPMPDYCVDGHTRRGRTNLYRLADRTGENWAKLFDKEFYFSRGLLEGYVPIRTDGEEEKYRKALMRHLGLPFDTYDIHECKQPRINESGGGQVTKDEPLASGKAQAGGVEIRATGNPDTGEVDPDHVEVESFTTPGQYYKVKVEKIPGGDLQVMDCSCPAYEHNPDRMCKHQQAVMRAGGTTT